MRKKRVEFRVSLVLPPDATAADAKDYVDYAVRIMCGGLNPGYDASGEENPYLADPMFFLDDETVRVTAIRKTKKPIRGRGERIYEIAEREDR
jgi:hypothetical protein